MFFILKFGLQREVHKSNNVSPFILLQAMEDHSLRTYHSNNRQVRNDTITSSSVDDVRDNKHEISGSSDSTMNEAALVTKTATMSSPQSAPSLRQNVNQSFMMDNKENSVLYPPRTSIGDAQPPISNACIPPQPLEQIISNRNDIDPYTTSICPPMMLYTNSLAFSDTSMPFPSLVSSKSFGPNGILHCNNSNNVAPITQFQRYPSFGQQTYHPSLSQLQTPENQDAYNMWHLQNNDEDSWKRSCNDGTNISDLNIAASALLDLTPATTHNDRFHHTQPQIAEAHDRDEMNLSGNEQICKRPENKAISRQNEIVDINIDASAILKILNVPIPTRKILNVPAPTRARMESRAHDLLNGVPYTLQACKCKNTRCLKLYCTCFQQGTFCDKLVCYCRKCENTEQHSQPRGSRTRAIYEILNRRIDAFEPRDRKQTGSGCSCRKSR